MLSVDDIVDSIIAQKRRERLLCDFEFFIKYFFRRQYGHEFIMAPHFYQIIDALIGVVSGKTKRLIINIPPRYGKTEVAVKMFVAWCLANNSAGKFIHLSYSDDLALDNSSTIRDLIKSDEYQREFDVKIKSDSDSKKKWYSTAGGGLYATAAGGAITGFGAGSMSRALTGTGSPADGFGGAIIIDDPVKSDDAFSDAMRIKINRRFNNTIASRTNSPDTPIIVIMQRLHENDMSGFLLAGGSGEEWNHLKICAITDSGDALWPAKHSIEKLRTMEQADPYTFAGQYMQVPSPLEGGTIKPDNIQIIPALPAGNIEWVRGWDFAASTGGDFTVGGKLGQLEDGRYIIGDIARMRVGPEERDAALVNTTTRDGYECRVSIPQDPGQAGKSQVKYLVGKLAGYSVHSSPETGNKVVRAEPLASQINVGNVLMLKAEWNDALISEMRMFPNGTFDDQVDALSRAFAMHINGGTAEIFIPDSEKGKTNIETNMPGLPSGVVEAVNTPIGEYCGNCSAFQDGRCMERGYLVASGDPGCELFVEV